MAAIFDQGRINVLLKIHTPRGPASVGFDWDILSTMTFLYVTSEPARSCHQLMDVADLKYFTKWDWEGGGGAARRQVD